MIDVYIASLPPNEAEERLSVEERQREIDDIKNERVRREKYYSWKLLEYALRNSFGDNNEISFFKSENRKWDSNVCRLSISHSGEALAVAVSKYNVGVDVERIRVRNAERMAQYIFTQSELEDYERISDEARDEYLITKWCQKEATFKLFDRATFTPKEIETSEFFYNTRAIELLGEKYILAVATAKENVKVRVFDNVKLYDKDL